MMKKLFFVIIAILLFATPTFAENKDVTFYIKVAEEFPEETVKIDVSGGEKNNIYTFYIDKKNNWLLRTSLPEGEYSVYGGGVPGDLQGKYNVTYPSFTVGSSNKMVEISCTENKKSIPLATVAPSSITAIEKPTPTPLVFTTIEPVEVEKESPYKLYVGIGLSIIVVASALFIYFKKR